MQLQTRKVNTLDLEATTYDLFFVGGFSAEIGSDFQVIVVDRTTGKNALIKTYWIKERRYIRARRAVGYFHFDIAKAGKYEISFRNFDTVRMKYFWHPMIKLISGYINPTKIEVELARKYA